MSESGKVIITHTQMTNLMYISISSDDSVYLADGKKGVYQSTDDGISWSLVFKSTDGWHCEQVFKVTTDQRIPSEHWRWAIITTIIFMCTVWTGDVLMVMWYGGISTSPQQMVNTLTCHTVVCRTTVTWTSFSVTVITKPFTCCQWMVNITVNYCHHITSRTTRIDWL